MREFRYSDRELSLMKNTFAGDDALLKTVRKVFYQMDITEEEAKRIEGLFSSDELLAVMRKVMLPEVDGSAALGETVDLFMTLAINEKPPEQISYDVQARSKVIEYIENGLERLRMPIKLGRGGIQTFTPVTILSESHTNFINLLARNTFISHVDKMLLSVKILAGQKEENVEDTKKRLLQDSSK